jgi:cytochrome b6-f complex iron-sulfur subunit
MTTELDATATGESRGTPRRGFLESFIGGSLLLLVAGWVATVLAYLAPAKERGEGDSGPLDAGAAADLPEGESKVLTHANNTVLVVHTKDGFVALSAVCTHLGCIVVWDKDSGQLLCPCHAGLFDLRGNVVSGPPPKPLPTFEVSVQDGKIMVAGA